MPSLSKIDATQRLLISIAMGVGVYFLTQNVRMSWMPHVLLAYIGSMLCLLAMSWITILRTTSAQLRKVAQKQDENHIGIFLINLTATITSLSAVILIVTSKGHEEPGETTDLTVAVVCMLVSWFVLHTIFTLRYAHSFYGDDPDRPDEHCGGLNFPGNGTPDYLDFAYFSFVLGMTFQVSDVEIAKSYLRRLALLHGLISFGYNTILVALTINVIAGLAH
jgi:uncharacterized membrane protein